jgi:hypothetical protein
MDDLANDLHKIFVDEVSFIANFAAGKTSLGFKDMFVTGNTVITPIPPTIYQFYWNNHKSRVVLNDQKLLISRSLVTSVNEIMKSTFTNEKELETKYRFQSFKMLTQVMTSSFMALNNNKPDKLMIRIRSVLDCLFPVLQDRQKENIYFVECASEVVHECILQNPNKFIVRELQKDIMAIFDLGPFFRCTSNTLKYWAKIIDVTAGLSKADMLDDYLKK